MTITRSMMAAAVLVLLAHSGAADAVDYHAVIAREFPGYSILPISEIDLAHADMTPQEIEGIKGSATLRQLQ